MGAVAARRPGFGISGKKIVVKANCFLVEVADIEINHYHVSISPEVSSKRVSRQIIKTLVDSYGASQLGNKSCYTAGELPFTSHVFVVKLGRETQFDVSIKHVSKTDLHHLKQFILGQQHDCPHEQLHILSVVFRQLSSIDCTVIGQSFFHGDLGPSGELGNGVSYKKGFFQSLRPCQKGLYLNIGTCARPFLEPILVSEFVRKYLQRDLSMPLSDQDRLKVKRALTGVTVEVKYSSQICRHKITDFSTEPIKDLKFSMNGSGETVSVAQYYDQKYKIVFTYPKLPAIQAGSGTNPNYLPMELCRIVDGQRYDTRLNNRQVTAMLRATCLFPQQFQSSIENIVRKNDYKDKQLLRDFGITVDPKLTSINARILPPPMVLYGRQKVINPTVGVWNMINTEMLNGGTVDFWACINFSSTLKQFDVDRFCRELIAMCTSMGMVFKPDPLVPIRKCQSNQIEKSLSALHSDCSKKLTCINEAAKHLQLLIIILPDISGSYGTIKRVCETELGIVSQCCQPSYVQKCNKPYLENVSLKINVKVDGRNSALVTPISKELFYGHEVMTIVFGADVTHPQPGDDSSASIAAVVASMDWPEATKYRALVSAQAHQEEIIQGLYSVTHDPGSGVQHVGMIRNHLLAFRNSNQGKMPDRIIFYRDGVSETQFNQVLLHEVDAIRKACASLADDYQPSITFVVVQKRHKTRLFPERHWDRQTTNKSGNILPGTVIDTKICHPREFDFYLCSHAGIKGTSRPAHYHVLYDENHFTADQLQCLTNNLCYTFARCTRSVSIVPPVQYAHLAVFAEGNCGSTSAGVAGWTATRDDEGSTSACEREALVRALPMIKGNVQEVMYYC